LHKWEIFLSLIFIPTLWLLIHYKYPRGVRVVREESAETRKRRLHIVFGCTAVSSLWFIAYIAMFGWHSKQQMSNEEYWISMGMLFILYAIWGILFDITEKRRIRNRVEAAARQWAGRPPWDPDRPWIAM
jgi:hypothetical protein